MLGLSWSRDEDTLAVEMPSEVKKLTKRTILQKLASIYDQKLASIYDPFEIISPTTIMEKLFTVMYVIPSFPGMMSYQVGL